MGESTLSELLRTWDALKADRHGVTALEYALIAALVAGVLVVGVTSVGTNLDTTFTTLAANI